MSEYPYDFYANEIVNYNCWKEKDGEDWQELVTVVERVSYTEYKIIKPDGHFAIVDEWRLSHIYPTNDPVLD